MILKLDLFIMEIIKIIKNIDDSYQIFKLPIKNLDGNLNNNNENIIEYKDTINWQYISKYENLNQDIIREYKDEVNWLKICIHQKLSENLIKEFRDKINWTFISKYQLLSESFIREFRNQVNWIQISSNQVLSESFIYEFVDRICFLFLSKNTKQKYYTLKFINDFKPVFNNYYKYIYSANLIRNTWIPKYYKPNSIGHLKATENFKNIFTS